MPDPSTPSSANSPDPNAPGFTTGFNPVAGLAAVVLPGLGHAVRGERKRGLLAGAGVAGLFVLGLLVGGVDVIDSKQDRLWFFAQAGVGPATFLVDHYHQNSLKVVAMRTVMTPRGAAQVPDSRSVNPDEGRTTDGKPRPLAQGERTPNSKSLGRVNELGTLLVALAGMMNLIVILDALFPRTWKKGAAS